MNLDTSIFLSTISKHRGIAAVCLDKSRKEMTYGDLFQAIEHNVRLLSDIGYTSSINKSAQQVILVDVALGWGFVPVMLAAMKLHITVVPIDSFHSPSQTKEILSSFPTETIFDSSNVDFSGKIIKKNITSFKTRKLYLELQDIAFILFTSGTTGKAKGVMLSYQNIWSNVADILDYFQLHPEDRLSIIRPLTHVSALTGELLPSLIVGCSLIIKKPQQAPLSMLKRMEELSITVLCAAPTLVGRFTRFASRYNLKNLRMIVLSGEVVSPSLFKKITNAFPGTQIWNAYGLTEASPRVSCWTGESKHYKHGCVGRPLKNVEVQIVDDTGFPVPEGTQGELIIRGPNVMQGYFRDEKLTQERILKGWLRTQDTASLHNGLLYIHGRRDDLVIRSGMNVYPTEIENNLLLISGVSEAFVFGKLNDQGETRIYAWVVGEPDLKPKHLFQSLIERKVDTRLWPDIIELKDHLPEAASGKRSRLRHHTNNTKEE